MRILIALALCALSACGSAWPGPVGPDGRPLSVPGSWTSVDSECQFSFRAPPDMRRQEEQGIDSCVGRYRSSTIDLSYDHGGYSDPLDYADRPGYEEARVVIDGRAGRLVSFRKEASFIAAVHFPDLGGGVKLTAWAECQDASSASTATLIFSTFDFK